jgi:hypothetical protein
LIQWYFLLDVDMDKIMIRSVLYIYF